MSIVLRERKLVSLSRRTISANHYALLLAIRVRRTSFYSSNIGPLVLAVAFLRQ